MSQICLGWGKKMPRASDRREKNTGGFSFVIQPSLLEEIRAFANSEYKGNVSAAIKETMEKRLLRRGAPLIGKIPCGEINDAIQTPERFVDVGDALFYRAGDFLLEAEGDSMAPTVENGDFVLLRPDAYFSNGQICAVQIYQDKGHEGDCQSTLKRVFQEINGSTVTLKPDNTKFKPREYDAEMVKIVGVYRGLVRRGE